MENLLKAPPFIAILVLCLLSNFSALSQECIPTLVSPETGAELDNGCDIVQDPGDWFFDWNNCEGAIKYHLYVKHHDSEYPAINVDTLLVSEFSTIGYGYILDRNRLDWRWKVRAFINDQWSEWSAERSFDVEPLNTDCQGICIVHLTQPENGKEVDNGCNDDSEIMSWLFNWTGCTEAVKYHLRVENEQYNIILIDNDSLESASYHYNVNSHIDDEYQFGWQWKVRTMIDDTWGPWSFESNFWVEETNTDCRVTGIDRAENTLSFIYPNPASTEVKIGVPLIRSIVLYEPDGRNIKSFDLSRHNQSEESISIDLQGIRPGVFILRIVHDDKVLSQKLIIQ